MLQLGLDFKWPEVTMEQDYHVGQHNPVLSPIDRI